MKKIILARHTETVHLASGGDKRSRNDSQLSLSGINQAISLSKFVNNHDYEAVITSLFQRSIQTAEIINTKKIQVFPSIAFSEYFIRDDNTEVETTDMAISRTMSFIYSIFDKFDTVLIVGHSSINKTILQALTNIEFSEAKEYFNSLGETHVLRLDWKAGDKVWGIVESFTP